jgi:hypothetical protein
VKNHEYEHEWITRTRARLNSSARSRSPARTHHLAPILFHALITIALNSSHCRLQHIEEDRMIRLREERPLDNLEIAAISRSRIL